MLSRNNIRVVTPALFPNLDPIWMLMHTAERFNVPLRPYGLTGTYKGWVDIKIYRMIRECKWLELDGISHLLYMDGRDTMLMGSIDEVLFKYELIYGSPPLLMSSTPEVFGSYRSYYDFGLYPTAIELGHPYQYPASCAFMGEVKYIRECLEWMLKSWDEPSMPDDDPAWWRRFDSERPKELTSGRIKFDHGCHVFVNAGGMIDGKESQFERALEFKKDRSGVIRVYNRLTNGWPVCFHLDGGYSHESTGKWDRMEEYWKALGYVSVRPPWETK